MEFFFCPPHEPAPDYTHTHMLAPGQAGLDHVCSPLVHMEVLKYRLDCILDCFRSAFIHFDLLVLYFLYHLEFVTTIVFEYL